MKITKVKIANRSLNIDFTEVKTLINPEGEPIESSRDVAMKCNDICHDSLIAAFDMLKTHAVLIADVREAIKVETAIAGGTFIYELNLEELANIQIQGVILGGSEEDGSESVMIILQKKTGTRTLNITTPAVKFEDPDYAYCSELSEVVTNCIDEVIAYMNGKVAVKQLEMNFDEGFDAEVAVSGAKEPKKRSKKLKLGGVDVEVSMTNEPEEKVA